MPQRRPASIVDHFGEGEDPRIERQKQHQLLDVIVIAICAVLCGADDWVAIETFGQAKRSLVPAIPSAAQWYSVP